MENMKTISGYTITTSGKIPHKWNSKGFYMPVAVKVSSDGNEAVAKRFDGRLVYALPGGGFYYG